MTDCEEDDKSQSGGPLLEIDAWNEKRPSMYDEHIFVVRFYVEIRTDFADKGKLLATPLVALATLAVSACTYAISSVGTPDIA